MKTTFFTVLRGGFHILCLHVTVSVLIPQTTAENDYCKLSSNHTMCLYQEVSPKCRQGIFRNGVSAADQKMIIEMHNHFRNLVASGKEHRGNPGPQPNATNMQPLQWDPELATIAQRWADQCDYKHDVCRKVDADLLFATNLKKGDDYHGAMDSGNFEKWVREKLLVGIKPLGSCMIVLDNASYHSRILERQPTMKWRKDQLVDWLQRNGVFPPPNVNKEFLQGLGYKHRSQLKRYVVDEMLIEAGHKVLRLPPYHCEFNPIELVWGLTKRYYDKVICSEGGQGLDRSIKVWKDALATVTPAVWRNCVQKTEGLILQTYEEEAAGIPEVEDLIINVEDSSISSASSDRDCDSDSNEELAIPLNNFLSVPRPSTS